MTAKTNAQRAKTKEPLFQERVRPENWQNPVPREVYDLAIVGAGPAGIAAAEKAVRLGLGVALIERGRLGGNSLNVGSVPSKAVIRTASIYAHLQDAEEFGAPLHEEPSIDFAMVLAHMRAIRARIAEYHSARRLARQGIDLFFGEARFEESHELVVPGGRIRFKKALVATGARPRPSNIPGLDKVGYCTSDSLFDMPTLPKRILVVGGGPLGCEMAQALRHLGLNVTIVQNDPKFLPREERDAAEILSRSLARCGVEIRLNTTVTRARMEGSTKILETYNNEVEANLEADEVLLSIGRIPNVEGLGLDQAGVAIDGDCGIAVDEHLRTSNADIYAAGDVCMDLKFTNVARATALMAIDNAFSGGGRRHTELLVPWCTYCDPEVAHVGMHIWDAHARNIPIKTFTVMMHDVDRAITDGQDEGFVKIHIEDGTDHILGATIVASRASEMINEVLVIMNAGISMTTLAGMVHAYPTQSEAIMLAARAYIENRCMAERTR